MTATDRGKLGNYLREVIDWNWKEFVDAEKDQKYTGYQSAVFALVRACSDGKLGAIKLAIDRIDGKIETPIRVEYPKVYMVYPEATRVALTPQDIEQAKLPAPEDLPEISADDLEEPEHKEDASVLTLKETLEKMADQPKALFMAILAQKVKVEAGKISDGDNVNEKIPLVKSVICANLLNLAQKSNFEAITEIFDRIDGKLVETFKVLGDDIFLPYYGLEAPAGAVKNKQGIYMIEAQEVTNRWKEKFKKD